MSARTLINVGLVFALLVVGAIGYVSFLSVTRMAETADWVAHTHRVQTSIRGTLAEVERAQSTQRGYIITGQPEYLANFRDAVQTARLERDTLRVLTADMPIQQQRLDMLDQLVAQRIALLEEAIAVFQAEGFAAVQSRIQAGTGTDLMQSIRQLLERMEEEEDALLARRTAAAEANTAASLRLLPLGSVIAGLLLIGAGGIINRELSSRRKREAELRSALEAAAAASHAKTAFLATVSHEIRTPLNAIIGMTELIRETPLTSEQAEFSRTVSSNAEALLVLINDLLDSSKIEAGQIDLEEIPFDVRDVVDGVAEILSVRADAKGLALVVDIQPDLPGRFLGDPNRLRQILMNLVGNAIKFTEQGEISIHAAVDGTVPDGTRAELHLAVRDTGVGIDAANQERVFERFVQADASTNRKFGGTGLGLNISQALAELMGGRMTLESEPGRGSTFHLFVPLRIPATSVPPLASHSLLHGVLAVVVEANTTARRAVEANLRAVGMLTRSFDTAAAALEHIEAATEIPAVVVLAERLPDGKGVDFARSLHQRKHPARIVLLCSLHSQAASQLGRAGIVDCVYRPVKQRRLLEAVGRAVSPEPKPMPAASPSPVARRSPRASAARVLLVEDNRDNWTLATRILTGAGYVVDLAENGGVAVERTERFRYDLVLMDLEMPVMDGFEATARIRSREREQGSDRVPIVALTAHAVEGFRERAMESGMDDYTTKPIKREQLLATVERWVDARPVVLVVDDSPENQTLIRNYLKSMELRLVSAYNGKEGVEAFRRQRVSVVFLDMDMPVMDGYETARTLRRLDEGRSVPILAMTGYEGPEEKQKCLNAGCSFYIAKPIRRAELLRLVDSLLDAPEADGAPQTIATEPTTGSDAAPSPEMPEAYREEISRLKQSIARGDLDEVRKATQSLEMAAARPDARDVSRISDEIRDAAEKADEQLAALWASRLADRLRDSQRLAALHGTGLLDAPEEDSFDRFTRLAAKMVGVPVSLISLVDADRQFFLSQCGLPESWATARETPLSHSFCQHVVASSEPLIVDDAREHPLVWDNLAIRDIDVLAYAGIPITSPDGQLLGSFCAIDTQPRHWTTEEISILRDFAAAVSNEINLRQALGQEEVGSSPSGRGAERATTRSEASRPEPASEAGVLVTIEDDMADLVPGFLQSRGRDVARIREQLQAGNFREIQRLGHNMKGSGEGYGFPEITAIGRDIEEAAKVDAADRVAASLERLAEYLQAVRVATPSGETVWIA